MPIYPLPKRKTNRGYSKYWGGIVGSEKIILEIFWNYRNYSITFVLQNEYNG